MKKALSQTADPLEETPENPDLPPLSPAPAAASRRARAAAPRVRLALALGMVVIVAAAVLRAAGV